MPWAGRRPLGMHPPSEGRVPRHAHYLYACTTAPPDTTGYGKEAGDTHPPVMHTCYSLHSHFGLVFCIDPDEVVLFAEAGTGLVGFIGGSSNDKYIVGRSPRPVAVGYDPIEKVSVVHFPSYSVGQSIISKIQSKHYYLEVSNTTFSALLKGIFRTALYYFRLFIGVMSRNVVSTGLICMVTTEKFSSMYQVESDLWMVS